MEKKQKLKTPYRKMQDTLNAYAHFGMGGGTNLISFLQRKSLRFFQIHMELIRGMLCPGGCRPGV